MNCLMFLLATLAVAQDTDDAKRAIAIVKKANGRIEFDDKLVDKPAVYLNL